MGRPAVGTSGISRLDLAKMAIEDLIRHWRKLRAEHSRILGRVTIDRQRCVMNLGQYINPTDQFFLLSTARQHPEAAVASSARFVESQQHQADVVVQQQQQERIESFQRELKGLQVVKSNQETQEDINYATGLNAALSGGLQILSRYRLHTSQTENFGMGRLPNCAVQTANGSPALSALQPACLILVTDGACLRLPPTQGGGTLQLQFGSQPLREFYREPFRWDQRIFVQAVGGRDGVSSNQYLHPQLRALCEVTGGSHWMVRDSSSLSAATDMLLKSISPPMPRDLPIPEPLFLKLQSTTIQPTINVGLSFINGGPICCFQALEADEKGKPSPILRAMLLYTSSSATTTTVAVSNSQERGAASASGSTTVLSPPLWCIPESFFPNKKLDTLPPRPAQPLLHFSKYPSNLGSKLFEPTQIIKMLHRYDQMLTINRKMSGQPLKYLHRDVYICEWLNPEGGKKSQVSISGARSEYFPVFVQGAGRPALSEESNTYLSIGILHVPTSQPGPNNNATITLLPPDPHVLLPLLIRAAEMEQKALKRTEAANNNQTNTAGGSTAGLIQKQAISLSAIPIDENWRSEFRAYFFRLPPYYQFVLKRTLRPILAASVHSLLNVEESEPLALQCFSKTCLQKIRNGEQVARDNTERLERQERELGSKTRAPEMTTSKDDRPTAVPYGQYDPRTSVDNYLAALRNLPPPSKTATNTGRRSGLDILGDLPAECLMAFYESRRRWIFGGPGLSIRGLHVEGVRNDGTNSQRCIAPGVGEECALSIAGIGVSTLNRTSTTKMGEYKERLLFSRSPVVGYGSNDSVGVAATTAVDGSPRWSVDDDALPVAFFDPETGEFADSAQARLRSKLQVNFGNPYKEKRADSLVPAKYKSQTPSRQKVGIGADTGEPGVAPGSPPHDSFDSVEENEALFVRASPSRTSPIREDPSHGEPQQATLPSPMKRPRANSVDSNDSSDSLAVIKDKISPPQPKKQSIPASPGIQLNLAETSATTNTPESSSSKPAVPSKPKPPKAPLPPPKRPPPPKPPSSAFPPQPKGPVPPPPGVQPPSSKPPSVGTPPPPRPTMTMPPKPPGPAQSKNPPNPPPPAPNASFPPKPVEAPLVRTVSQNSAASRSNSLTADSLAPAASKVTTSSTAATTGTDVDYENPDVRPSVDLPTGWITNWSKSKKRWYFFDQKTNKSVWHWPPP